MLVDRPFRAGMGRAVLTPTHNSLLSDYYRRRARRRLPHRPSVGQLRGASSWAADRRAAGVLPRLAGAVLLLRHPDRSSWSWRSGSGSRARRARRRRTGAGASEEVVATTRPPPSWAESVRILWQIRTLRRIWASLPFLALSIVGLLPSARSTTRRSSASPRSQRGFVAAVAEPAQVVGILIGIPWRRASCARIQAWGSACSLVAVGIAGAWVAFSRWRPAAVAIGLERPDLRHRRTPRARHLRIAVAGHPPEGAIARVLDGFVCVLPGLIVLYIVGGIADGYGIRQGLLIMVPVFLIGGLILSSRPRS